MMMTHRFFCSVKNAGSSTAAVRNDKKRRARSSEIKYRNRRYKVLIRRSSKTCCQKIAVVTSSLRNRTLRKKNSMMGIANSSSPQASGLVKIITGHYFTLFYAFGKQVQERTVDVQVRFFRHARSSCRKSVTAVFANSSNDRISIPPYFTPSNASSTARIASTSDSGTRFSNRC